MWAMILSKMTGLGALVRPASLVMLLLCVSVVYLSFRVQSLQHEVVSAQLALKDKEMNMASLQYQFDSVNQKLVQENKRVSDSLRVIEDLNSKLKAASTAKVKVIRELKTDGTCNGAMQLLRSKGVPQ